MSKNVSQKFLTDALGELKESILETIQIEILNSIQSLRATIIDNLIAENKRLSQRCDDYERRIKTLEANENEFRNRFASQNIKLVELESNSIENNQRSRKNNIEISGIPNDILDENLENACIAILNSGLEDDDQINHLDVEACHRLFAREGPKPVIIRFASRKTRIKVFDARRSIHVADHSY